MKERFRRRLKFTDADAAGVALPRHTTYVFRDALGMLIPASIRTCRVHDKAYGESPDLALRLVRIDVSNLKRQPCLR